MDKKYASFHYETTRIEDLVEGFSGLILTRTGSGKIEQVAKIVFWDADGQFSFEATNIEIPLAIVEELIAEAKSSIKIS